MFHFHHNRGPVGLSLSRLGTHTRTKRHPRITSPVNPGPAGRAARPGAQVTRARYIGARATHGLARAAEDQGST
eukprot:scaffold171_cov61-Phaeocystis_antarctica.AAC.3